MAETLNEQEQLIADLLEEAHALRMKYEEFSLYTEAKIAEFVIARKALTEERDHAVHHRGLAERLDDMIAERIAVSRPVTLEEVDGRRLPARLRDGVARLFSPYL